MSQKQDDARRREDAAIRNEQKFDDFLLKYEEDKQESLAWRLKIEKELKPLSGVYQALYTPMNIARIVAYLAITPAAGFLGWAFIKKSVIFIGRALAKP